MQKLLEELENPESGVKEYGMSIDDGLYLIKYIRTLEKQKEELLSTVKSTANGSLVASERDKNAMQKAMKTIGLLNSMILSGEEHSETSRKMMEDAIVDILHASQFKVEESKNGATLVAATHLT